LLKANPPLQNVCPIINCQHFYILSMEHYVSPVLQKEIVQNVILGIIILEVIFSCIDVQAHAQPH